MYGLDRRKHVADLLHYVLRGNGGIHVHANDMVQE